MVNKRVYEFLQRNLDENELQSLMEASLDSLKFDFNDTFHVLIRILRPPKEESICNVGELDQYIANPKLVFETLLQNYHAIMNEGSAGTTFDCNCHCPHRQSSLTKVNYEISVLKLFNWIITYNEATSVENKSLDNFLNCISQTRNPKQNMTSALEKCVSIANSFLSNDSNSTNIL